ncbi:MAG TPA: Gfo/Idh/MocA family oxidoreductase [Acidimicrobiales bacterium]
MQSTTPLPNGLHAEWTIKALEAGKPVLCEKPFRANAAEAEQVAAVAARTGLVVMEAFHYRYHPMFQRAVDIVRGDELGALRRVESALCFTLPRFSDIRYQWDLAGGATMDAGCYPIHMARTLGGEVPEVTGATAKLARRPDRPGHDGSKPSGPQWPMAPRRSPRPLTRSPTCGLSTPSTERPGCGRLGWRRKGPRGAGGGRRRNERPT